MTTIQFVCPAGTNIRNAIQAAIEVCKLQEADGDALEGGLRIVTSLPERVVQTIGGLLNSSRTLVDDGHPGKVTVSFEFNDVDISVKSDSDAELILRDFHRAMSSYIGKQVGPYPSEQLTEEEVASDAAIEAENEARRQERQAKSDAKVNTKREATKARLAEAPVMEFSDEEAWKTYVTANAADGYGAACVRYAEMWARLMQLEVANGANLSDIADATSLEADIEGITGFMYDMAVSILSQSWIHGEQLRRWDN